ncbi:MAG TPA: hypothetical protein VF148_13500 [Acidimicrobiia bacterium]
MLSTVVDVVDVAVVETVVAAVVAADVVVSGAVAAGVVDTSDAPLQALNATARTRAANAWPDLMVLPLSPTSTPRAE